MDGGDVHSEGVRTLWSVSTKFARQMSLHNCFRHKYHACVSFNENLAFLRNLNDKLYGSRGEGIVYPLEIVDHRDMDFVYVDTETIAVETASEREPYDQEIYVYLVDRVGSLPGYCRLRQLYHNTPSLHSTKEFNGINYLLNTWAKDQIKSKLYEFPLGLQFNSSFPDSSLGSMDEKGPSISREIRGMNLHFGLSPRGYNITKLDNVHVIKHPKWPSCASEWRDRIRCYGWPSHQQINKITNKGIYLAPVGSTQVELKDIQWRYSFNEAERELVRSFNSTQTNCYILLKMLVSEYITPHFPDDVISSYHIKTLLFWAVEQTDPQLWVPRNLVELIFRILNVLLDCVAKLYCPSYFIPEENLFTGKITADNKECVSQALLKVMNEGWVALTRLKHFAKDEDFIKSLYEDSDIVEVQELGENLVTDKVTTSIITFFYGSVNILECILHLLHQVSCCSLHETGKMDDYFNEVINKLLQRIHLSDNDINKRMSQNILAFVRCIYGTHFLSLSRCPSLERGGNCIMEQLGLVYTSHACKSNLVECIAKRANYTYMTEDFQSTIEAATQLLDRNARFPLKPLGVPRSIQALLDCYLTTYLNAVIYGRNIFDLFDNYCFLGWIIFLKNEIYALPGDARVELFCVISTGNQLQTICRNWFGLSPFVYVAYLGFLVNIGRRCEQQAEVYLKIMERICRNSNSYESSSINLLGASYIKLGQHEKAMKMFRISIKRQRGETNAAVWHVARFLWRKLRDR